MKHTLIIGGGAAGYAAAITAARKGDHVLILERGRKPLKKLGVTGNGRGNLLNAGAPQYFGDESFALEVLRHMPYADIADFLKSCGISLAEEDEGRIYPSSFLAASAVDALRLTAQKLGVRCEANTRAVAIQRLGGGFAVRALRAVYAPDVTLKSGRVKPGQQLGEEEVRFDADRVIVAAGGAASPAHGTDGSAYPLLTALGHQLVAPRPALCALTAAKKDVEGLSGQRVRALLTLDGTHKSHGEALFADDGVSGIAAMALARFVRQGSHLSIDLRESVMGLEWRMDVVSWLMRRPGQTMGEKLIGACAPALSAALVRKAGLTAASAPSEERCHALAGVIRAFDVSLTGTRGFDSAQVTAGGIAASDFDPATMESRLCAGLYAAGEVLDVDGACGGFNLMFAFASGLLAGRQ